MRDFPHRTLASSLAPHMPSSRHGSSALLWGLPCAYIALLYLRNLLRIGISREYTEAIIIIVLLMSVFAFATRSGPLQFRRSEGLVCWAVLFVGLIIISAFVAGVTASALAESLYHVVSVCLSFWVFSELSRTRRGITSLAATLGICAAINAGVGLWGAVTHRNLLAFGPVSILYQDSFGYDPTNGRSGGLIGENYAGMFNVPVVVAGLFFLRRRNWRWLGVLLVLLGTAGTVVSASRASILSALVATCIFQVLGMRKRRLGTILGGVLALLLLICVGVLVYHVYITNIPASTAQGIEARFTAEGTLHDQRTVLAERYAREVFDRPFAGHGPGYIKERAGLRVVGNERVVVGDQVSHNSFIDVALEFGLPALVMFVIAMFRPVATFRAARGGGLVSYLYACFIGMLIPLFTLSNPFGPIVWAMGGATVGAVGCERQLVSYRRHRGPRDWRTRS